MLKSEEGNKKMSLYAYLNYLRERFLYAQYCNMLQGSRDLDSPLSSIETKDWVLGLHPYGP